MALKKNFAIPDHRGKNSVHPNAYIKVGRPILVDEFSDKWQIKITIWHDQHARDGNNPSPKLKSLSYEPSASEVATYLTETEFKKLNQSSTERAYALIKTKTINGFDFTNAVDVIE